jgi:acylphosphatase
MSSDKLKTYQFLIDGFVQGVGFRFYVRRKAELINIPGYVRNLYDGKVEVVATCNDLQYEIFLNYLYTGSSRSRVKSIEVNDMPFIDFNDNFEIK